MERSETRSFCPHQNSMSPTLAVRACPLELRRWQTEEPLRVGLHRTMIWPDQDSGARFNVSSSTCDPRETGMQKRSAAGIIYLKLVRVVQFVPVKLDPLNRAKKIRSESSESYGFVNIADEFDRIQLNVRNRRSAICHRFVLW